jgi:hypothetical protein
MRKTKKFITMWLVGLMMSVCLLFSGCSIKGEYKLEKIYYDDGRNSMIVGIGEKYDGVELKEDMITLILESDKTAILRVYYERGYNDFDREVQKGTWHEGVNGEYYLDFDGEIIVLKKDGRKVSLNIDDNTKVILTK